MGATRLDLKTTGMGLGSHVDDVDARVLMDDLCRGSKLMIRSEEERGERKCIKATDLITPRPQP